VIYLGYEKVAEYYRDSGAGVILVRTSWVNWREVDLIGCPSVVRTRD
jgi:hypothetical protein